MLDKRTLEPDLGAARRHLRMLTGEADPAVAWQVVCDYDRTRSDLAQNFHGTLDRVLPRLIQSQLEGCGVLVAVNRTDGTFRRRQSMTEARALLLDLGGAPLPGSWPVQPALINCVANGALLKFQCWWPIEPTEDFQGWAAFQRLLAIKYDGDPDCTAITKLGRVAGFYNQQDREQPWRIETVEDHAGQFGVAWTMEELAAAFQFDLDAGLVEPRDRDELRLEVPPNGWNNQVDIDRARVFLAREANWHNPSTRQGSVFRAAANLRDLGISEDLAAELIAAAIPIYPDDWAPDHIERRVRDAYQHAVGEPGGQSLAGDIVAMAETEIAPASLSYGDEAVVPEPAAADLADDVDAFINELVELGRVPEQQIPPLRWIMQSYLPAGDVTLLAGPGGVGKSLLAVTLAIVVASGQGCGPFPPPEERRVVLMLSGEDDVAELERRVAAVCRAMQLDQAALAPYLLMVPTRAVPLLVKDRKSGRIGHTALYRNVFQTVRRLQVGLLIADPATRLARGFDDAGSDDQDALLAELQKLVSGDGVAAALLLGDSEGNEPPGPTRLAAARNVLRLAPMTAETFQRLGIDATRSPADFVELSRPRASRARRAATAKVFELVGQRLANGEQRPTLVYRPLLEAGIAGPDPAEQEQQAVRELVARGAPDGRPWRVTPPTGAPHRLEGAVARALGIPSADARRRLAQLVARGVLSKSATPLPGTRRRIQCWTVAPDRSARN